jgi:hypothetical protein
MLLSFPSPVSGLCNESLEFRQRLPKSKDKTKLKVIASFTSIPIRSTHAVRIELQCRDLKVGPHEYGVGMLANIPQRTVKSVQEGKGKNKKNDLSFVTSHLLEWTLYHSAIKLRYWSAISALLRTFVRSRMVEQVNR